MEYVATFDEWMAKYRDAGAKELYAQQLADGIAATLISKSSEKVMTAHIGFMSFLYKDFVIKITRENNSTFKVHDSRCSHDIVTATDTKARLYPNKAFATYTNNTEHAQLQHDISTEPALSGITCSLLPVYTATDPKGHAAAVVGAAVAAYICDRFKELDFGTHCYDATTTDFGLNEKPTTSE